MPNTKSAEKRTRSSARKHAHNRGIQSRVKTLEKSYADLVKSGKKEEATAALRLVSSALDKAAKTGTLRRATTNRKKSRLALRLNCAQ
jgi:small subunit ribosomal protein S20